MSALRARLTEAQLALVLLTRLPAGRLSDDCPNTSAAAWAFPLVGALVGLITGAVYLAASLALPPLAAALLSVASGVALTGALHEDGLADLADGFGGGTTRDQKLEIMRDSRIGSYGVVALILVMGLIASAIASAPAHASTLAVFIAIGAISRAAMTLPMALLPPARADGLGQGAALSPGRVLWTAIALAILVALATDPRLLIATAATTALMLWLAKRQINGQTGDVLGATQKLNECACWLTAAAYINAS